MAEGVLIGIDIGTSSSKGVLVTTDGRIVARSTKPHDTSYPHPGWVEHDAESVWWNDFTAIVRDLLPAAEGRTIEGLGVSGIGPVLLPADGDGNPLRPAILYGVDTRATTEIAELTEEFGADEILRRGGSALTSQAVGPKIRWLAKNEPEVYARTEKLLMCSSYLVHRLTGRYVLDHHSASQCDPLYDLRARDWSKDWAQRVAPDLPLPELAWPTEVVGRVGAHAAAETGLPEGLPVTTGTIDAWAEATSAGVREPGDVMLMYGTTMFFVQVLTDPRPHSALWGTCGVFPDTYTLAAGMATSGAVTDWIRRLVDGDFAELVEQAAGAPAGSRGLLLLPYFAGERTPIFDPDARGALLGLTTSHGRAEVYRAALEGIGYGVRHNLEAMSSAGGRAGRLVAVGGGTQGGLWTQIVSDISGQEQQIPSETVGAAFGDALMAGIATGTAVDERQWNPVARTVVPDPERTERYDAFYQHYLELYRATADIQHFLARQQHAADD
ncbi:MULTISPECIES: FGGY-family carbohydrate kinase [unclassified Saccharopolyspora]|uniref:FGGY-family carbohydrate kinase n=1 Tax=unclassified Saccharopolyspora TaxID=2646250 RepID=UPI001CD57390|nr:MULTISPECIES: FGGY-family carbohydrate kinase [unclassified Saccharopolyspora]MCA1189417.1 FGGY-family carbohydrate kinase [Saccharopolyspora sp. 6T]MCA1228704.1 FGGY-family carbohydrate kinase [Saccharopolyspora sp. 6M]MCA1282674.1 FGGY-family carbohydrate kinase [Saccharopolyspora sp. 7B]